jgi:hypothetical protein
MHGLRSPVFLDCSPSAIRDLQIVHEMGAIPKRRLWSAKMKRFAECGIALGLVGTACAVVSLVSGLV